MKPASTGARTSRVAFVAEIALALTEGHGLPDMLHRCAQAIVNHLSGTVARVWTVKPPGSALELQAVAGEAGTRELGDRIELVPSDASDAGLDFPNRAAQLALRSDEEFVGRRRLTGSAAYPLTLDERLVGVITIFAPMPFPRSALEALASVARILALGIERKLLDEAHMRLADLLEAATDFVTLGQAAGPPLYINRAARVALGIAADEHVPSLAQFRPPWFREFFDRTVLPTVIRDGVWRGEAEYLARDGRLIPVSQVSVAHRNGQGQLAYLSTISRDISNEKRAEEVLKTTAAALQEAQDRTQFAMDAAKAGVWDLDVATGRMTWSDTMYRLHGITLGEFDGTTEGLLALFHADDREAMAHAMRQSLDQVDDFASEARIVWPNGQVRWTQARGRVQRSADGQPLRVLGVTQDVTERKHIEDQLQEAHRIEASGQLAGGLAHDFNNLLTVVLGNSALLLEQFAESDCRRAEVEQIRQAGERAAALTRQLLTFSRKQVLNLVLLDLNDLIRGINPMLCRLLGEDVQVTVRLASGLEAIKADSGQMEMVLVNLAVNARDAMPQGGQLTLETASVELDQTFARSHLSVQPGRYALLTVSDTGMGMDATTRRRIFEPFFTTKERGKGTGLGLASVFGIVKQIGGSIWVYSEPGLGSTFKVYLPVAQEQGVAQADAQALETPAALANGYETILVVEDEDAVRTFVEAALTRRGYHVIAAASPLDATRVAIDLQQRIDLLVSDVVMPVMSGPDLYHRLRDARPGLRALFMSGFADDAVANHGVLGSDRFIQKPFTGPDLAQKVRDVLDRDKRTVRQ